MILTRMSSAYADLVIFFAKEVRKFSRGFYHVTFFNIIKVIVLQVKAVHDLQHVCEGISIIKLQ